METKTNPQNTSEITFSFDDDARNNITLNDQAKIRDAVCILGNDGIAMRLLGLDIRGDIFLARVSKIKAIRIERDQKSILRLGYIDRRDRSDGRNHLEFGIWMVVSDRSEAFKPYW